MSRIKFAQLAMLFLMGAENRFKDHFPPIAGTELPENLKLQLIFLTKKENRFKDQFSRIPRIPQISPTPPRRQKWRRKK